VSDAQRLTGALNSAAKAPSFGYQKARSTARADDRVDWTATKAHNGEFNPEVDGCESFVMKDGSVCEWLPARRAFAARPAR